jgi:hypothetical protein
MNQLDDMGNVLRLSKVISKDLEANIGQVSTSVNIFNNYAMMITSSCNI